MICFRDKTFCTAKCGADCPERLTTEILAAAKKWWSEIDPTDTGGPPISQGDFGALCPNFEEIKDETSL